MLKPACFSFALLPCIAWAQPVTTVHDADGYTLDNGQVQIHLSQVTGSLTAIRQRDANGWHDLAVTARHAPYEAPGDDIDNPSRTAMYWDANAQPEPLPASAAPASKGYFRPPAGHIEVLLEPPSAQRAEVVVKVAPSALFPFASQVHYLLFANQPGFYAYAVLEHDAAQPAATLYQTRFVVKTVVDGTFTHWAPGDGRFVPLPNSAISQKLSDVTWRLADGTIKSKYLNSTFWAQAPVYGYVGARRGLWMIEASGEYHNGGPSKQGQTVHDNVLLRDLQSVHFGASPVVLAKGEAWRKVYGPFLVYANQGPGPQALQADAGRQQRREQAQWPYGWVDDADYAQARGSVSGSVAGAAGARAWVILGDPGVPWTAQSKGYGFWTPLDSHGRFRLAHVRPGTYDLAVSGADHPADIVQTAVKVEAGRNTALPGLAWPREVGVRRLWQIGTFDRSAAEFRNGRDPRHFQMYRRYAEQFPQDVDYVVGQSRPGRDWNYAQWTVYNLRPDWRVHFKVTQAIVGQARLTLGFASAQPARGQRHTALRVSINGHELPVIALSKTGTAGYRGSAQDSPYTLRTLTFDAHWLKPGDNLLSLGHADAEPMNGFQARQARTGETSPGQVMYDALRLELLP